MAKRKLAPFLLSRVESNSIPGLRWYDREERLIQIPWKHFNDSTYKAEEDGYIFKDYAIQFGHLAIGHDNDPNYPRWKELFRNALTHSTEFDVGKRRKGFLIVKYTGTDLHSSPREEQSSSISAFPSSNTEVQNGESLPDIDDMISGAAQNSELIYALSNCNGDPTLKNFDTKFEIQYIKYAGKIIDNSSKTFDTPAILTHNNTTKKNISINCEKNRAEIHLPQPGEPYVGEDSKQKKDIEKILKCISEGGITIWSEKGDIYLENNSKLQVFYYTENLMAGIKVKRNVPSKIFDMTTFTGSLCLIGDNVLSTCVYISLGYDCNTCKKIDKARLSLVINSCYAVRYRQSLKMDSYDSSVLLSSNLNDDLRNALPSIDDSSRMSFE